MFNAPCLWNRPRLERYADGALGPRLTRSVQTHLEHCAECVGRVERQLELRSLVKSAFSQGEEPDWTGFWPAVEARIRREQPHPMRDPWWAPLWRPVWGHPRLAFGGVGGLAVATLALAFTLWPAGEGQIPLAWADPVVVQDVGAPDPAATVVVYSAPEHGLTVIWLLEPEAGTTTTDES